MLRIFLRPNGIEVNLVSTTNQGDMPPLLLELPEEHRRLSLRDVERRLSALPTLHAIVHLLDTGRAAILENAIAAGQAQADNVDAPGFDREYKAMKAAGDAAISRGDALRKDLDAHDGCSHRQALIRVRSFWAARGRAYDRERRKIDALRTDGASLDQLRWPRSSSKTRYT